MSKTMNTFDEAGAKALAERIAAYWAERGKRPTITLVRAGYNAQMRSTRMDIRSDMVNGLPRG